MGSALISHQISSRFLPGSFPHWYKLEFFLKQGRLSAMLRRLFLLCTFSFFATAVQGQKPVLTTTAPLKAAPSVVAKRAIVVDHLTGQVLYAKNADTKCAVASTQKMLTALCVLEAGSLSDKVYVQKTDTYVEPTKVYISPGEVYTRGDLVKALVVKSGNDVARALARDIAGSETTFANLMNRKAHQLGMRNSYFLNPHGLTAGGQYSTARDVATLARASYAEPILREHMKNKGYYFMYPNGKRKWLTNTNRLLKSVPYCVGMKTGTTRASGRCLISVGVHNGRTIIVVCLGSDSANIWKDSEKLLRWSLERPAAR